MYKCVKIKKREDKQNSKCMANNLCSPPLVTLLKGSSLPFLWQPTWSAQERKYMTLNKMTQTCTFRQT